MITTKNWKGIRMLCPCGSLVEFSNCCQAIIEGIKNAHTAEQLMRSRYSAYSTQNANYIYDTYSKISQKDQIISDIAAWSSQTRWLKLVIHPIDISTDDKTILTKKCAESTIEIYDWVSFSAYYLQDNKLMKMSEISRFITEEQQWRYLDGEVSEHLQLATPSRNALCFCDSGKKFKRCCGK